MHEWSNWNIRSHCSTCVLRKTVRPLEEHPQKRCVLFQQDELLFLKSDNLFISKRCRSKRYRSYHGRDNADQLCSVTWGLLPIFIDLLIGATVLWLFQASSSTMKQVKLDARELRVVESKKVRSTYVSLDKHFLWNCIVTHLSGFGQKRDAVLP